MTTKKINKEKQPPSGVGRASNDMVNCNSVTNANSAGFWMSTHFLCDYESPFLSGYMDI